MKKLAAVVFLSLFFIKMGYAVSLKPYVKSGTIDFSEKDHSEATGHKSMVGAGVELVFEGKIEKILGLEYWTMAEPEDDDSKIIHDGAFIFGRANCQLFEISSIEIWPFAQIDVQRWRRNSDSKKFGELYFSDIVFGINSKYKNIYFETKANFPFWSDTDNGQKTSGKLGIGANAGLEWKKLVFELSYNQNKFEDFRMEQYFLSLGYRF